MQNKNSSQLAATILPLAVILLSPAGASAAAVKTGQAVASPGVSGVTGNLMSRPGVLGSGLSALSGGLQLSLVPGSILAAPAVQDSVRQAPAVLGPAPILAAPQAQSPVAAAPVQPGALGSVQQTVQTIQADEAKAGSSEQGGVIGKLFDGGSGAAVPGGDGLAPLAGRDGSAASYLGRAPKTLFSESIPVWKDAGAPSETDLQVKGDNGALTDVGDDKDFIEDVAVKSEPVKVELPEPVYGEDRVGLQRWVVTGGVRYAALTKTGVFWVDATGNVFLYRRASAQTVRVMVDGKLGPVTVSEGGEHIYAVVDGRLQRWGIMADEFAGKSVKADAVDGAKVLALEPLNAGDVNGRGDGVQIVMEGKRLFWGKITSYGTSKFVSQTEGAEQITKNGSLRSGLTQVGRALYTEKTAAGTRVWLKPFFGSETKLEDIGSLPFEIQALAAGRDRGTYFAVTPQGVVEWDTKTRRYRVFPVASLEAVGTVLGIDTDPENRVLVSGSHGLTQLELSPAQDFLASKAAEVRLWSQQNPMYIKDGALHIGDFSFPLARKTAAARPWYKRAFDRLLGRTAPAEVLDLGVSEKEWQALNLPTNKRLIYDTLKGFSLSQHMLYIGETGGGKTWIAERIAKLTSNELWMVSMNEYTRNKDLIARETFGEEGKNKTGLTMSTVLRWMTEGGVLLLDEMHKPLEGIAVLNNILQNGEYRMPDGRIIKYDKKKSWVIGTMNPVKPPYKGEPPSGELSSRFGMTLEVKYLPPDEEAALLNIFYSKVPRIVLEKLVAIANDLRKVYPDILPLPIAPRTLMHIVEHAAKYPNDSIVDIFRKTYNPASIVEDPAIDEAILKVLEAHDLAGTGVKPAKAEPAPKKADDDVPF